MCEKSNNTNECSCLHDLLKEIIRLQKQDNSCCNEDGCDKFRTNT